MANVEKCRLKVRKLRTRTRFLLFSCVNENHTHEKLPGFKTISADDIMVDAADLYREMTNG